MKFINSVRQLETVFLRSFPCKRVKRQQQANSSGDSTGAAPWAPHCGFGEPGSRKTNSAPPSFSAAQPVRQRQTLHFMRRGEGGAAFRRDGLQDHRGLKCTWAVSGPPDPRARQHSLVPAQLGPRCFYCSPWLLALPPSPSSSRRRGSCLQPRSVPSPQKAEGPEAFFVFWFF